MNSQGRDGKDTGHLLQRDTSYFSSQAAAFLQGPDHHTEASQGLVDFRGVGVDISSINRHWMVQSSRLCSFIVDVVS